MPRLALLPALALATLAAPTLHAQPQTPQAPKAVGVTADAVREAVDTLPTQLQAPNRHALVIGADGYADPRIPGLPACANDARGLFDVLTSPTVGLFPPQNVTLLTNQQVTEDRIVDALDQLGRRTGPDDLVVVFFSGHGAVDSRGRSYWVMHDTQIDKLRATALAENEITALLGDIQTTRLVTLIDACYSASTASLGENKSLLDVGKLYPSFKGKGRVAITASAGDQLSVVIPQGQPGHGYSAFAHHAIQGLKGAADGTAGQQHDGVITVDELWSYVKDRTATTARQAGGQQQPQLKGQLDSRFMLTVDANALVNLNQATQRSLRTLSDLLRDDRLTGHQYTEAKRLLTTPAHQLAPQELKRRRIYDDLTAGRLDPVYLGTVLGPAHGQTTRPAPLPHTEHPPPPAQHPSPAGRTPQVQQSLATARRQHQRGQHAAALQTLAQTLQRAPTHPQALALREEVRGVYGSFTPGQHWTSPHNMVMAYIPAGEFVMGSSSTLDTERNSDERTRQVHITRPFMMTAGEITQSQWAQVMNTTFEQQRKKDGWFSGKKGVGDAFPVYYVSWDEARAFCEALSRAEGRVYRLPTEAEWEYACRAGTATMFHNGNNTALLKDVAWFEKNARGATHAVGSKAPNAWGLYDMHGNVREWCADWYGPYGNDVVDPQGPPDGKRRVLRGGSWDGGWQSSRSAYRKRSEPDQRSKYVGFRVVLELDPDNPLNP